MLPTVLIGIVAISFDTATRRSALMASMEKEMRKVLATCSVDLPHFFTPGRIELLRAVFDHMDADGELSLDVNECAPFYHYAFLRLFNQTLDQAQVECIFHLMDFDGDSSLGVAEFVMFVAVIKQIEMRCKQEPAFAAEAFPGTKFDKKSIAERSNWESAMTRLDAAAPDQVWDAIFSHLKISSLTEKEQARKIKALFTSMDVGENDVLSVDELARGLEKVGALASPKQVATFFKSMDANKNGKISSDEFLTSVLENLAKRKAELKAKKEEKAKSSKSFRRRASFNGDSSLGQSFDASFLDEELEHESAEGGVTADSEGDSPKGARRFGGPSSPPLADTPAKASPATMSPAGTPPALDDAAAWSPAAAMGGAMGGSGSDWSEDSDRSLEEVVGLCASACAARVAARLALTEGPGGQCSVLSVRQALAEDLGQRVADDFLWRSGPGSFAGAPGGGNWGGGGEGAAVGYSIGGGDSAGPYQQPRIKKPSSLDELNGTAGLASLALSLLGISGQSSDQSRDTSRDHGMVVPAHMPVHAPTGEAGSPSLEAAQTPRIQQRQQQQRQQQRQQAAAFSPALSSPLGSPFASTTAGRHPGSLPQPPQQPPSQPLPQRRSMTPSRRAHGLRTLHHTSQGLPPTRASQQKMARLLGTAGAGSASGPASESADTRSLSSNSSSPHAQPHALGHAQDNHLMPRATPSPHGSRGRQEVRLPFSPVGAATPVRSPLGAGHGGATARGASQGGQVEMSLDRRPAEPRAPVAAGLAAGRVSPRVPAASPAASISRARAHGSDSLRYGHVGHRGHGRHGDGEKEEDEGDEVGVLRAVRPAIAGSGPTIRPAPSLSAPHSAGSVSRSRISQSADRGSGFY